MPNLIDQFDISSDALSSHLRDVLLSADDGELYIEHSQSEGLVFDNGRLKQASYNEDKGFGLRLVAGEAVGYAHSGALTSTSFQRACHAVSAVGKGYSGHYSEAPSKSSVKLYSTDNPLLGPSFEEKVSILKSIDEYVRVKDNRVRQVSISLGASHQIVEILRGNGSPVQDIRPLVRLSISVVVGVGDRQESGSYGAGGRRGFEEFISHNNWRVGADEALRQALVNLEAVAAPAGTFDIVLSNGWPGVMLHEAVGHGLEGDFNRKKTSAFAGLIGQQVAAKGVSVVDDGTLVGRRGSLNIDDEGTPTHCTTLIDDGILVGYMQDRQNARLMGVQSTGNGRRESYAHVPMPRMTNTYMLNGAYHPQEIIESVKRGIYAVSFGGGQVDITSGKFVFGCTEAYMIENGKIGAPIKGAMLIGNGPEAMHKIPMVGNDMALDLGIGMCGKQGQGVPVGVGQPHLRMNDVTVGGTQR
jgi:TldD protein